MRNYRKLLRITKELHGIAKNNMQLCWYLKKLHLESASGGGGLQKNERLSHLQIKYFSDHRFQGIV